MEHLPSIVDGINASVGHFARCLTAIRLQPGTLLQYSFLPLDPLINHYKALTGDKDAPKPSAPQDLSGWRKAVNKVAGW